MPEITYGIPRKTKDFGYALSRQHAIMKIARKGPINQANLSKELDKIGFHMAEMTLQSYLRRLISEGQINAQRKGRETIYSIPSMVNVLREFEIDLQSCINIRKMVYQTMQERFDDKKYPAVSKAAYLQGNMKMLLDDINKLVVLEALKGKKGLYQDIENSLKQILGDMLALTAKDKEGTEILSTVIPLIMGPRAVVRSAAFMDFWQSPAAPEKQSSTDKSKNRKN